MEISTALIKELRESSGAGVMDAKRALEEAGGDMKLARDILREKGVAAAAKRADRETLNGVVDSYIHAGGRIGVLVEINCETDFVANTEDFRTLARNVSMQVAAMSPAFISPEERAGAPVVEGSDDEVCLLRQPYIRDPKLTIADLVQETVAKTGENVRIRRFVRFELGR